MTYQFTFPESDTRPRILSARRTRHARGFFEVAAILALFTVLIRFPDLGNPTYHIDEAFYLLFGEKMNEGLAAYREIWDRKPFGLFILYAALAQFGSVYAYQLTAMVFAWGTSLAITEMALRFASRTGAVAAGILYIALLGALAGGGGQSPVFYNLFIALAALISLRRLLGETGSANRSDCLAMFLCGLALTIKPTALPEGIFLGLVLLTARWRTTRSLRALGLQTLILCVTAVLPTVLILCYFWAVGDLDAYIFATVRSIFLTVGHPLNAILGQSLYLGFKLFLIVVVAIAGCGVLAGRARTRGGNAFLVAGFVGGWLVSAAAGFLMVPNFFDHYALPVASALALAAAAVFDRPRIGRAAAITVISQILLVSGYPLGQFERTRASREGFETAAQTIASHAGSGCVFLYDVTAALYRGVRTCPANKFAFPEHLSNRREAGAIGADPVTALDAVLANRPSVIALPVSPSVYTPNRTTRAIVERYLARHYHRVGVANLRDVVGGQTITIWQRKSRARPPERTELRGRALAEK